MSELTARASRTLDVEGDHDPQPARPLADPNDHDVGQPDQQRAHAGRARRDLGASVTRSSEALAAGLTSDDAFDGVGKLVEVADLELGGAVLGIGFHLRVVDVPLAHRFGIEPERRLGASCDPGQR